MRLEQKKNEWKLIHCWRGIDPAAVDDYDATCIENRILYVFGIKIINYVPGII